MRRWLSLTLVILIPTIYIAGFLAMSWIRSQQGQSAAYPSEIEALAIHRQPADPLADARARGRIVFRHYCQVCHGAGGQGDGSNASQLATPPRDFTQSKFWASTTDERVHFAVAQGGPSVGKSVLMPAWGHTLSKPQIDDVIVYLRAFVAKQSGGSKVKTDAKQE
jgi:cytochrome c oxidase cbb3-type subunit III